MIDYKSQAVITLEEFEKKAESTLDRLSSLISGQANDKEKKEEKLTSTSKVSGDMWG